MSLRSGINRSCQGGLSIVELLVSIAVGLLVSLTVMYAYISGSKMQAVQSDHVRLSDTARVALSVLTDQVMQTGYANIYALNKPAAGFSTLTPALRGSDGSSSGLPVTPGTSDELTVRFFGENLDASQTISDSSMKTCTGQALARDEMVRQTFKVIYPTVATSEPVLVCETQVLSNAGSSVLSAVEIVHIARGVENFQIMYGVDFQGRATNGAIDSSLPADGIVDAYLSAADINAATGAMTANRLWESVVSVRVSIVVRTKSEGGAQIAADRTASYAIPIESFPGITPAMSNELGDYTPPQDGRLRKQYIKTIAIRNALK